MISFFGYGRDFFPYLQHYLVPFKDHNTDKLATIASHNSPPFAKAPATIPFSQLTSQQTQ